MTKDIKNKFAGKFIVLDGGDGCGKSTQAGLVSRWLNENGVQTATFRDPGDTVIGEKIRAILLDTAHESMADNTELLLYMAARAQLWKEKIAPALQEGKCVIMDRWVSSTCAYQGCAGNFGIEKVITIADDTLERTWPDITIILEANLKTAAKRMDRDLDRMEQKGDTYHNKVRQGFSELAEKYEKVKKIDASKTIEQVFANVKTTLENSI
ncbi:MAG: dTMP kinase [Planctomycetes bacterium]|nr:dTMP kinase [Planctomycetota bacterium]